MTTNMMQIHHHHQQQHRHNGDNEQPKLWKPNGRRLGRLKSKFMNSKLLSPSSSSQSNNNNKTGSGSPYNLATGEYEYGSESSSYNHIDDSEHLLSSEHGGIDNISNRHVVSTWQERDDIFGGSSSGPVDLDEVDDDENDNHNHNNNDDDDDLFGGRRGAAASSSYNKDVHWWMTPQFDPDKERNDAVTKLQDKIAQLEKERDDLHQRLEEQQLLEAYAIKMNATTTTAGAAAGTPTTSASTTPSSLLSTPPTKTSSSSAAAAAFTAFTSNSNNSDDENDVFDFFGLIMDEDESTSNKSKKLNRADISGCFEEQEDEGDKNEKDGNAVAAVAANSTTTPEQITFQGFPAVDDDHNDENLDNITPDPNFAFGNANEFGGVQTTPSGSGGENKSNDEDNDDDGDDDDDSKNKHPSVVEKPADGTMNDETNKSPTSTIEIDGISLLDERDHLDNPRRSPHDKLLSGPTAQQYKDLKSLMTFNALQLIQKQRQWLDTMSGKKASPASMISIKIELENLERKIRGPSSTSVEGEDSDASENGHKSKDNRVDISGETAQLEAAVQAGKAKAEGTKVPFVPMEPSKAMFKAMSLLDDSLQHFQKGCMKGFGKMNQLLKALKDDVDQLEAKNASLVEEIAVLHQQNIQQTSMNKVLVSSLQKLKSERDEFASTVEQVEKQLSTMAPPSSHSTAAGSTIYDDASDDDDEEKKENEDLTFTSRHSTKNDDDVNRHVTTSVLSKIGHVQEYIDSLKVTAQAESEFESELSTITQQASGDSTDKSSSTQVSPLVADLRRQVDQLTKTNETMMAQHASEKRELRSNLESSWKQVDHLTASLAERNSSIATFVQETNATKTQLTNLEEDNKGFKAVADEKSELLLTATTRIDVLQEELLRVEEELRTMEVEYDDHKTTSVEGLKKANKEWSEELERVKSEHEKARRTLQEQLQSVESERDRMVRDLKASISDLESERDLIKSSSTKDNDPAMVDVSIGDDETKDPVENLEQRFNQEDQLQSFQSKMAHKAAQQANLIAQLQHENELKDAHMQEMKELIEHLSERQGGLKSLLANAKGRQWGSLVSKISDRSLHGSFHGSFHGP